MWNHQIPFFMQSRTGEHAWRPEEYPHFTRWQNAMLARPAVAKVVTLLDEKEVNKGV
jgi:glutathione S-transferase